MAVQTIRKCFIRTDGGWVCATSHDSHHTLADAIAAVQVSHGRRADALAADGIAVTRRERVTSDLLQRIPGAVAAWSTVWTSGAIDEEWIVPA